MDDPEDCYPQAKKLKPSSEDPYCSLPFYLQDLCLLVVINDLGSYSTDLLASLPYWLRHRLLRCVPALDLCRLEGTAIAKGVNIDDIWMARLKKRSTDRLISFSAADKTGTCFPLNVHRDRHSFQSLAHRFSAKQSKELIEKVTADVSSDEEITPGHKHLLEIASDLLTDSSGSVTTTAETSIHQLISIPGDLLFSNLKTGTMHETYSQEVWKLQSIPLEIKITRTHHAVPFGSYYSGIRRVELTPQYLKSIAERCDVVEVLSRLTEGSQIRPPCVNIHIGALTPPVMSSLCAENFAFDHNLKDSAKCTTIIWRLLQNVSVLSLQCDTHDHIGLLVGMINVAIADKEKCRLKNLLCTMPDISLDVSEPFTGLFLRQSFQMLVLDLDKIDSDNVLSKLFQAFLTAPCQRKQKVVIYTKQGFKFPMSIEDNQLASMDMAGMNVPSCGVEHKALEFSSQGLDYFTNSLYMLLQFPSIRLRKLTLTDLEEYSHYFHLCAIHPDLQVKKLVLDVTTDEADTLPTLREDLVSLLKLPSLQKITVVGDWGKFVEIKDGLVRGLQARSQLHHPLKKLSLELESAHMYKIRDFRMVCDAIFSFPQLYNLSIVLGKGFVDMIKQRSYREVMIKSWNQKGSQIKLKSICLQTRELKLEKIDRITHDLSFSWKPRSYYGYVINDYDDNYDCGLYGDESDDEFY